MKFSLIGTGNAAWHFAGMLRMKGHTLYQLYGRNELEVREFGAELITSPANLSDQNDLIIIAVKDDAIAEISRLIPNDIPTIHVSGATSMQVLNQKKRGVVWPVQTLKKNEFTDHATTPFLIEASDDDFKKILLDLFGSISTSVFYASGDKRARAHMATVFANNFTTQLLAISEEILKEQDLPLSVVIPSMKEIIQKLDIKSPLEVQTGPARRADSATLNKQLNFLKERPDLQEIYRLFTNRILHIFHGKKL